MKGEPFMIELMIMVLMKLDVMTQKKAERMQITWNPCMMDSTGQFFYPVRKLVRNI